MKSVFKCISIIGLFLFFLPGIIFAKTGIVKGSYINIRKEPKFNSPLIGKKMRGDRYTIEFEKNNWVRVAFNDGVTGWLYKTLIERREESLEDVKVKPEPSAKPTKKTEKKAVKKAEKEEKPKVEKKAPEKEIKKIEKSEAAKVVETSGSAEELYNEAIKLYEKKKFAEALDKNKQAFKKAPQNAEILNNIGNCLFKMGRIEEALDSWKDALKISPKSGKICNNLGIAYYQLDQNKKAIEYYKKAILFEPQFPDPYYNVASVYGFSGKFEDAILNYQKYLEFSPDSTMKKLAEERIDYCQRQVDRKAKAKKN
jgi:tetratricopeptide (TPR) repeat protein